MKGKYIDLHMHTDYSDGTYSVNQVIEMSKNKNAKIISITDHNNVEAYEEINDTSNIEIIRGVEISTNYKPGEMHILGYNIDIYNPELLKAFEDMKTKSIYRIIALLSILESDYNLTFDYSDIKDMIFKKGIIGRPDIANLCVKYKYSEYSQQAFDNYLIDANKKIPPFSKGFSIEKSMNVILTSGGIPVLAHPYSLNLNECELKKTLLTLKELGLEGIEAYHSNHSVNQTKLYLSLAKELNLYVSCGSDYHGLAKPNIEICSGLNNNLLIEDVSIIKRLSL